jgi:hypothetical protein
VARNAPEGEVSGFINLQGIPMRVPFWYRVERPKLPLDRHITLARPGVYGGDTSHGAARVTSYRYPDIPAGNASFPVRLPGREIVYRVHVRRRFANFGVAVLSRAHGVVVEPRIVRANDENRLAGLSALPFDLNPYRPSNGRHRLVAGVLLPAPGSYDIVFDTPARGRAGRFSFRLWEGDTRPPAVRLLGVRGATLPLRVSDGGAGVDPTSLSARIDGQERAVSYVSGIARVSVVHLKKGGHSLSFSVADFQEVKNNENVAGILPNTRKIQQTFLIP